jgi:hypothetical protein
VGEQAIPGQFNDEAQVDRCRRPDDPSKLESRARQVEAVCWLEMVAVPGTNIDSISDSAI